jgi:hypothetical protein
MMVYSKYLSVSLSAVAPDGTAAVPVRASLGIGPADIFVALALIYVLAYLYLLDPMSINSDKKAQLRVLLLGCAIPLSAAFLGVVLYTSITII